MVTIYKMLDPDTKQIRYIGKTTQTMKQRLYNHLHGKQSGHSGEMREWLDELMAQEKEPIMVCITTVDDKWAKAMELGLIFFYKTKLNVPLFNGYKFPGSVTSWRLDYHNPKTEAEAIKAIYTDAPPQQDAHPLTEEAKT